MPTRQPVQPPTAAPFLASTRPAPPPRRRWLVATTSALVILLAASAAARGQAPRPRLGAAVSIVADGSAPWEDRPITVAGAGVLTGTLGVADPGDDLAADDGVVRTYDSLAVRLSYVVLDGSAGDLTLVATLDPELMWQPGEETRLDLEGCPGGARVQANRSVLTCVVGVVDVPPAVTGLVDAVARVRGSAPHGAQAGVSLRVTDSTGQPDPDPVRCPEPLANGCRATAPAVRVSAALALDTHKHTIYSQSLETRGGEQGWLVSWLAEVMAGGDGDLRGTAAPSPAAVVVHDWWRTTSADGQPVPADATLVGCHSVPDGAFTCTQPGGPDTPIEVTISNLDPDRLSPTTDGDRLVRYRDQYGKLAQVHIRLFHPLRAVAAAGGAMRIRNCFATVPGDETAAEYAPLDVGGLPNLGGLAEPLSDNCAVGTLLLPRPAEVVEPEIQKHYQPGRTTELVEVVPGEEFRSEAIFDNASRVGLPDFQGVVLCDAFDNQTQRLVVDAQAGAAAWALASTSGNPAQVRLSPDEVELEFAAGPWGTWAGPGVSRGQAWYAQSTSGCADAVAVNAAGWVGAADVDFSDAGRGLLDARDVNLVRARFRDPVAPSERRRLLTGIAALPNPPGTFLVNYAAGYTSTAPFDYPPASRRQVARARCASHCAATRSRCRSSTPAAPRWRSWRCPPRSSPSRPPISRCAMPT